MGSRELREPVGLMEPNIPLLRKVVEWVEWQDQLEEGKEWYQGTWFHQNYFAEEEWCDSAMCVAGKVVTDAGWVLVKQDLSRSLVAKNGYMEAVWDVAAELLGLDDITAGNLFDGGNEAHDIRRIAEEIAGERL